MEKSVFKTFGILSRKWANKIKKKKKKLNISRIKKSLKNDFK